MLLNYDILDCIADYLTAEDLLSLCLTCKALYENLLKQSPSNIALCEKTLKNTAPYSWEYKITQGRTWSTSDERKRDYREALQRYCARKRAFALGRPVAAYLLSSDLALDFVYGDGSVVYIADGLLNYIDLRKGRRQSMSLDELAGFIPSSGQILNCELIWLRNEVVAVTVAVDHVSTNCDQTLLLALDFADCEASRPLMAPQCLDTTRKFFVRHNREFLYWGTHAGTSNTHNYREWIIQGVSLRNNVSFDTSCPSQGRLSPKLQLRDFPGSQIGTEVDFCIHHGNFYAVSNCTFELVEIDWTSFYHCISFPLNNPVPAAIRQNERIYRRQHEDGVVLDGWTTLSLQVDEETDELMIVEGRDEYQRDYHPDCPRHSRTWYSTPIKFEKDDFSPSSGPVNDLFYPLREPKSNYAPKQSRPPKHVHHERLHPHFGASLAQLRQTKFMMYNLNTHSFLDVVLKVDCPVDGSCLQLRAGRRWIKLNANYGDSVVDDESGYCYNDVQIWPSPAYYSRYAATARSAMPLADVHQQSISGLPMRIMGDDRFLLLLLHDDYQGGPSKLLLLSFDKFATIPAENFLVADSMSTSSKAISSRSDICSSQLSDPIMASFSSIGRWVDDEEIPYAENLDIDDFMDEAWL